MLTSDRCAHLRHTPSCGISGKQHVFKPWFWLAVSVSIIHQITLKVIAVISSITVVVIIVVVWTLPSTWVEVMFKTVFYNYGYGYHSWCGRPLRLPSSVHFQHLQWMERTNQMPPCAYSTLGMHQPTPTVLHSRHGNMQTLAWQEQEDRSRENCDEKS